MKEKLQRSGAFFLTAFFLAATTHGQPAPGGTRPTPPLAAYKLAVVVVEPPSNWDKSRPEEGIKDGYTGTPRIRFNSAIAIAQQFKSAGADVQLYFMGPAVLWLTIEDTASPSNAAHPALIQGLHGPHELTERVRTQGIDIHADENSSQNLKIHDKVATRTPKFFGTKGTEPGLSKLAAQGYHIMIF